MRIARRSRFANKFTSRAAVAAVEAAVCLPVLVLVWFGSFELARLLSLKQQAQLLSSTAANRVLDSDDSFEVIETRLENLAVDLGIEDVDATVTRIDSEVVESSVTIDFGRNSPLSALLAGRQVNSTYYSFREE